VQKVPLHAREVRANGYRSHKPERPLLALAVCQVLEDGVLKMGKCFRDAKAGFVLGVLAGMDGAAHCTALPVLPVDAAYDFVGIVVSLKLCEDRVLLGLVAVEGNEVRHGSLPFH
jgi:hypothetical protein